MVRKCCVPGCSSNYSSSSKTGYVNVFTFPIDTDRRSLWIKSIPRENLTVNSNTVVCIKHFDEQCIVSYDQHVDDDGTEHLIKRHRLSLREDAVPTIFPGLPSYLSSNVTPTRKDPEMRRREAAIREEHELDNWLAADNIMDYEDLLQRCEATSVNNDWLFHKNLDYLLF